ncbi:MAG: hypothetical protein WCA78_03570 [Rhizomicrobium sp.]
MIICLYAGADAVSMVIAYGSNSLGMLPALIACFALFLATGLLFIGGYGAASSRSGLPQLRHLKSIEFAPSFNDLVFFAFVCLSFVNQIIFALIHHSGIFVNGFEQAIYFVVPGQRALVGALTGCGFDGGRIFASAITWLLSIIYLCSSLSRLKLEAGILRLERRTQPNALGPLAAAILLGIVAVIGVQMLFVGSAFAFLPCSAYADIPGDLLIGLTPLLLAYLILAALATLLASGKER